MSAGNRKRRKELGLLPSGQKCAARKSNGDPCNAAPMRGSAVCRMHGGSAPQVRRKAAERLALLLDDSVSFAGRILHDEGADPALRLKAAQWIASVNGFTPGMRVELSVGPSFSDRVEEIEAAMADDEQLQRVRQRLTGELGSGAAPPALPPGREDDDTVFPEYADSPVPEGGYTEGEIVPGHYGPQPHHPGPPTGPHVRIAHIQR